MPFCNFRGPDSRKFTCNFNVKGVGRTIEGRDLTGPKAGSRVMRVMTVAHSAQVRAKPPWIMFCHELVLNYP